MPYLSAPDDTATSFSCRGVTFEGLNGRFWVDDQDIVAEMVSHGYTVAQNQEDDAAAAPEGQPAAKRGRQSKGTA